MKVSKNGTILDVVFIGFFVLIKLYQNPEVLNDLKSILALDGVVNSDKIDDFLNEVFNLIENKMFDRSECFYFCKK